MRNKVKKIEGDKTEMNRVIQEAKQRIGGESAIHNQSINQSINRPINQSINHTRLGFWAPEG